MVGRDADLALCSERMTTKSKRRRRCETEGSQRILGSGVHVKGLEKDTSSLENAVFYGSWQVECFEEGSMEAGSHFGGSSGLIALFHSARYVKAVVVKVVILTVMMELTVKSSHLRRWVVRT